MVWLDPMPVEEDIGKAYRSYYTHEDDVPPANNLARRLYSRVRMSYIRTKYRYHRAERNRWDHLLSFLAYLNPLRRANFDFSVFYLKSKPHGRLLELGCGSGAMLKSMKDLGWHVAGVDFDLAAVEQARRKGITVYSGTLVDQKFPDQTFDAIVASHFIEHIPDPLGTLRECQRLLKPGGLLVVITPNADGWGHRLYGADWRGLEPPRHLQIFTPSSLSLIFSQAGFVDFDCRSVVRANGILLASKMLRSRGKLNRERFLSAVPRLWAEVTGLAQWAVSAVDYAAGEEIVMISARGRSEKQ